MLKDRRKHKRVEITHEVQWTVSSQRLSGTGKLHNVGLHGACIRIESPVVPSASWIFALEVESLPAMPRLSRLRWFHKNTSQPGVFVCGLVFQDVIGAAWSDWVYQALAPPVSEVPSQSRFG